MSRLARLLRSLAGNPPPVAALSDAVYTEAGNQWYPPPLAGPSTLSPMVIGATAVRRAMGVLERLECDAYHEYVLRFYRAGLERFPDGWAYADLYTTLAGLALAIQPRRYLEIGVRHGHSMAMVLAQAPVCRAVGFDLWVENYAGLEHRGRPFVEQQLRGLGIEQSAELIDGNSADTVPAFLAADPERFFDLVTVDGDHSARGARADLENVLPRVTLGGAVVFDDVNNPSHPDLRGVWTSTMAAHPEFSGWMFDEVGFGAAFAVRMR